MMYRFLRIVPEAVSGTYDSVSTADVWIRCDQPNMIAPFMVPKLWTVNDGMGLNEPAVRGIGRVAVGTTLKLRLCATNAATLLGWAAQKITAAPLPWTTDQRIGDFASCTVDLAWSYDGLTLKRQRALGVKVASWSLETQSSDSDPFLYLTLNLIGMVVQGNVIDSSSDPDATAFPAPAISDFATDYYTIQHSSSHVTLAGTARTRYRKLSISSDNMMAAYWDAGYFANRVRSNGVKRTLVAELLHESGADRTKYEAQTSAGSCSVQFVRGGSSMLLNFNSGNQVDDVKEDFVLDEDNYYTMTLTNFINSTSTGLTLTVV